MQKNQTSHPTSKNNNYSLSVIEEVTSPTNGKLLVTTNPLLGVNIITPQKIAQSGDIMIATWRKALQRIKNINIQNVLILGYGGGSAATVIHQIWLKAKVTGIEIDPLMIHLGKKYLQLKDNNDKIIIMDALKFKSDKVYDLILMDIFTNYTVPKQFISGNYLNKIKSQLSPFGVLILNYLDLPETQEGLEQAKDNLAKIFKNISFMKFRKDLLITCFK